MVADAHAGCSDNKKTEHQRMRQPIQLPNFGGSYNTQANNLICQISTRGHKICILITRGSCIWDSCILTLRSDRFDTSGADVGAS